jgi:surface antigen
MDLAMPGRARLSSLLSAALTAALTAVLLAGILPARAANLGFLSDSAFSYFNEADLKLFGAALEEALNKAAIGDTQTWSNDQTRSSGEIRTLGEFKRDGQNCRTILVTNRARSLVGRTEYRLCRQDSGRWAMVE